MALVLGGERIADGLITSYLDAGDVAKLPAAHRVEPFAPPYPGCTRRTEKVTLGVFHWTGGEAGVRGADDDGTFVARVLRGRTADDGSPMPLSVEFVIGADGRIWQLADPLRTACKHAGAVNARAWGCEIVNKGLGVALPERPREHVTHRVHGQRVTQLGFTTAQRVSAVYLAGLLCDRLGIPKAVPVDGADEAEQDRMKPSRLVHFEGVVEHLHVSSKKVDAGTQIVRSLLAAGFVGIGPH